MSEKNPVVAEKTEKTPRFRPDLADAAELVKAGHATLRRVPARGEVGGAKYVPEHDAIVLKGNRASQLAAFKGNEKHFAEAVSFAYNLFSKREGSGDPAVAEKREAVSLFKSLSAKSEKLRVGSPVAKMVAAQLSAIEASYPGIGADVKKAAAKKAANKAAEATA